MAKNVEQFSKNTFQTFINITLLLLKAKISLVSVKGQLFHMQYSFIVLLTNDYSRIVLRQFFFFNKLFCVKNRMHKSCKRPLSFRVIGKTKEKCKYI